MGYTSAIPEPGQLVEVRRRRYVVVDIVQSTLPSSGKQHLVTLSSVEDDALGEELQVIWEVEPGATAIEKTPLPAPTAGFDTPQRLDTFLNAVRWGAASSADIEAIQAPFRSGIDLEDYQLDPVARAIRMPRVNLLIADDVGLGKTIEAGLVIQELIIRHRARKILILCPAPLQVQWREQMRDKFGLEFRIIDSKTVSELRRERGPYVNPWSHFPRLIASTEYFKRERPFRLFTETLPREGESVYPRSYDLLIVDEAHNMAPSGRGKYATDSIRTRALRRIAPHFEHKLFLSATPHNGYRESFTALLELLDNQRFARGVEADDRQLRTVMVRRLKSELEKRWDGSPRFSRRKVEPIEVQYTDEEREIHRALQEYTQERLKRLRTNGDQQAHYAMEFVTKLLKKRLFSSPKAFLLTLQKHMDTLAHPDRKETVSRRPQMGILRKRLEEIEEEDLDDETLSDTTAEALEIAASMLTDISQRERELLDVMHRWAEQAATRPDSKAQELIRWLHATIKPGGRWSRERVIIFTEFLDTQLWLYNLLEREGFTERGPDGQRRVLRLYGGMETEEREQIKAAFQANPDVASVRILLATDTASEGINLQNYCSRLIHYEIPWNPNRLEQRNGRIDRHGQRAPEVLIHHFVSSTYKQASSATRRDQLDDDLEFLGTVVEKLKQIREDLGSLAPVIATQVEEKMLGYRRTLDTTKAEQNLPSKRVKAFEKKQRDELNKRIKQLEEQLGKERDKLKLYPENIQAVVETALELAKQPPLRKRILKDPHGVYPPIEVFDVPELSGSWARCTEGLEHPLMRDQRRPIVFDHALARGRDDVVLAHLNHRLVTMSLRLLRAEVWSQGDQRSLYRVTARIVRHHALRTPVVVAHARLLILGGDNQRLHEELIVAGGALTGDGFKSMDADQLQDVLDAAGDNPVSARVQESIRRLWDSHRDALAEALERHMNKRMRSLELTLRKREEQEKLDITTVLRELQTSIRKEIEPRTGPAQLMLEGFSDAEREQYKRDVQALQERADAIDGEIEEEVKRIQQRFANPRPRLFPVAVTYLFPPHLAY
ncbi:ERCC4-related helicase [Thermosporothrix hazakensis]|uniref:ERCC4-related helicase n=1 Tax=Thermosporothrix hazakensis TaxID=644383 RepID=A0A326U5D1_THEHA|nr:DISARM system SNF2-like helicase DrmD [Thermosporothrix hazakensis]PZW28508.1 ERCC4-related helicase [Thermosporothrix hazakensis]GCE45282.1 helicase SNF2 family protein [Thermosporothrix hazakensis]